MLVQSGTWTLDLPHCSSAFYNVSERSINFTFLPWIGRLRNLKNFKTYLLSYCSSYEILCFSSSTFPSSLWFAYGPNLLTWPFLSVPLVLPCRSDFWTLWESFLHPLKMSRIFFLELSHTHTHTIYTVLPFLSLLWYAWLSSTLKLVLQQLRSSPLSILLKISIP